MKGRIRYVYQSPWVSVRQDELKERGKTRLSPQQVSVFVTHVSDDQLAAAVNAPRVDDILDVAAVPLEKVRLKIAQGEITNGFSISQSFYSS